MATPRYSIKITDKNNKEWWFNGFSYEGYALKGLINKYHTTNTTAKKIKLLLDNSFEEFKCTEIVKKKDYTEQDIIDTIN